MTCLQLAPKVKPCLQKIELTSHTAAGKIRQLIYGSFRLPDTAKVDTIAANYIDDVLELEISEIEERVKATKEIKITK